VQRFQVKPNLYWIKGELDVHKRLEVTFILRICGPEKRRGSRWALFLIQHLKLQGTIADLSPYTYPQQTVHPTHSKASLIKIRHLFFLFSEIDFLTLPRVWNPVGSCQGNAAQSYSWWVLGKIIGYIYWGFAYCPLEQIKSYNYMTASFRILFSWLVIRPSPAKRDWCVTFYHTWSLLYFKTT
jgi:hypothetical protein